MEERFVEVVGAFRDILQRLGEDTTREGLLDTPKRYAKMMFDLTRGLRTDPPRITTFDKGDTDQMVVVRGLDFHSLCEHHMIPFFGQVHVGYLPGERIIGLSKFGHVVDWYAARPQIQEVLTSQVADFFDKQLQPKGIIVVIEAKHLCMSIRGVKKANHLTVTSAIRGNIVRPEFFDILKTSNE